jgi:hypothetical protein
MVTTVDVTIRVAEAELERLLPRHMYSALDEPADDAPSLCGVTEWKVPGARALSFGWDWSAGPGTRLLGHWGTLRTNVVLVDAQGRVLPEAALQRGVEQLMLRWQWQRVVAQVLGLPTP